jgi:hypothetical protein
MRTTNDTSTGNNSAAGACAVDRYVHRHQAHVVLVRRTTSEQTKVEQLELDEAGGDIRGDRKWMMRTSRTSVLLQTLPEFPTR